MSKSHTSMLDRLSVISPCSEDWEQMSGNDQVRFCSHCAESVHNLSEMTSLEAMALVRKSRGRLCVRYQRRPDGATQTATESLHRIKRRASRIAAGAFTATLSLCTSVAAQTPPPSAASAANNVQIVKPYEERERAERDGGWDGTLTGTVVDTQGAVVPSVTVTLVDLKSNSELTTTTNSEGIYRFQALRPGQYTLKADGVQGFSAIEKQNFPLPQPDQSAANLTLIADTENVTMGGAMIAEPSQPLVSAAFKEDLQAARELLASGVDVNIRDEDTDSTALMQAVGNGNREMVRLLLDAGADVNAKNGSDQTPLMMTGENTTAEIVWSLISAGAKVNRKDEQGHTPLIMAALGSNPAVIEALVEADAKVNAKDEEGRTALTYAAAMGHVENVRALLKAGADVSHKDNDNETALSRARDNEQDEVVKLLEAYGAHE
jgi:hypothetical protein